MYYATVLRVGQLFPTMKGYPGHRTQSTGQHIKVPIQSVIYFRYRLLEAPSSIYLEPSKIQRTTRHKAKCYLLPPLQVWASETLASIYAMVSLPLKIVSCHSLTYVIGMSYPISGQNPGYRQEGYQVDYPIIPHGVSVAVSAPAVFRFTGASNPDRHLAAAEAFGVDISNVKKESAGEVLSEALSKFLADLGGQPKGLKDLGFKREHLDDLVEGTIPQARVLMLAPGLASEIGEEREQLRNLFEDAMQH